MTPMQYLSQLSPLQLAHHCRQAHRAGRTPCEQAAYVLSERARLAADAEQPRHKGT